MSTKNKEKEILEETVKKNAEAEQESVETTQEDTTTDQSENAEEQDDQSSNEIESLKKELQEAKDKYVRLYAEFDNYKKRTAKERIDLRNTANRETITALLPILDDFDRAKKSADDENTNEVFSEGVQLVYNKLHNTLAAQGLKPIESTGEVFDPEIHEAITEIPAPTKEMSGKVIDTVEKGYTLKDVIIRHSKVVVGK